MNPQPAPIELAREADFALGLAQVRPALRLFAANSVEETVEPRVMQVLVALARRAGDVVGRDELVALCWEGRVIGEDAIQRAIAKVRKLGEISGAFAIETIAKVGYRLKTQRLAGEPIIPAAPALDRNNLPRRLEAMIGRDSDVTAIANLLRHADLVTITGPGGVGKTRLALEAARRAIGAHEDGVWLVELAPVNEAADIAALIARSMAFPGACESTNELLQHLGSRRALLVLDNCEHLVEAVAELAEHILQHAPAIKLLATSQEPLGVAGERVFRLRSLNDNDAALLFETRAKAADSNFMVTPQSAEMIRSICRRLDGIPLAIEMAAARAPALGCDNLLERLDDRFRVLTGGRRTALPRQRTLQATLDWSHSLLSATEASVFRRLAAFGPSVSYYSLEDVSVLGSDDSIDASAVLDALASLTAKSLVAGEHHEGLPRYRLLETMRAYAQEKLCEAGERDAVQSRFLNERTPHFPHKEISPAHYSEMAGAALRAAHALDAATPKIFVDPFALPLSGLSAVEAIAFAKKTEPILQDQLTTLWVLRNRYADDRLRAARDRVAQCVILAAGLASTGLRVAEQGFNVYEVDESSLQKWKRERLASFGAALPEHLFFASCDLERCSPAEALGDTHYDRGAPSFIWLVATHQLGADAIVRTLQWAASQASGSEIVLSYVVPSALADVLATASNPRGDRWRTFFSPEDITNLLHRLGFHNIEHLTEEDANNRYFDGRSDGLRAPFLERLVSASVG